MQLLIAKKKRSEHLQYLIFSWVLMVCNGRYLPKVIQGSTTVEPSTGPFVPLICLRSDGKPQLNIGATDKAGSDTQLAAFV